MPANVYECLFLLDTTKVAGDVPAATKQIHTILERHHCEVLASRPWDERRLAYPVNGQKKGLYYLTYFRSDGKSLAEMERDVALNEMIMRSLVLRVDAKHVDTMLAIARDEHALALQVAPGADDAGDDDFDRGPRRRRDFDKD
ncbi:MAG TPA: 30S ribosomal protein S6 [Methyloceanibacter sp.]|jgi:small subunit ribosomal protein S6|nr:30S ribosomal protein S6 [Methyloceanibacter sp.]